MSETSHLDALARAATVYLSHAAARTHAADQFDAAAHAGAAMWGSGFFIAPGWVLTCAHVVAPHLKGCQNLVFHVHIGTAPGGTPPIEARLHSWLLSGTGAGPIAVGEDLALIRLLDDGVQHECVWFTDRADQLTGTGTGRTVYGYRRESADHPGAVPWSGDVDIAVRDGEYGLRFAPTLELPKGVSGGPVLDRASGAVVGMVKSRPIDRHGGRAIAAGALRQFGDTYRTVMAAHDSWHHSRLLGSSYSWPAEQERLRRAGTSASDPWTPADRTGALRLLGSLMPPEGSPTVAALVRAARGGESPPQYCPAPLLCWRDGHGELYAPGSPFEAVAFLHYLRLVSLFVQSRGGEAAGLDAWVAQRAERVPAYLRPAITAARLPEDVRPVRAEGQSARLVPYPGPGEAATVVVELEPVLYQEPTRFYWRIRIDDGDAGGLPFEADEDGPGAEPGELIQRLRRPLSRAFQGVDTDDRPAPLEVAVPLEHFDTGVHRWYLVEEARLDDMARLTLGARRPVVFRSIERRGDPDTSWVDRWEGVSKASALSAWRTPPRGLPPQARQLREIPAGGIPVLCRPTRDDFGRRAMRAALDAGHGVALWHIGGHPAGGCQDSCDRLHTKVSEMVRQLGAAAELPDWLRRIRERMWRQTPGGMTDADHWAEGLVLLYDDPRRPIPAGSEETVDSP
jgi:hypothetical protein